MDLVQPKREGYTFEGMVRNRYQKRYTGYDYRPPVERQNLYGKLERKFYTIVFNVEGEVTRGEMKNIPLRYTQETTIPKTDMCAGGYKFVGWRTGERKVSKKYIKPGDKVSRLCATNNGTVNLYPIWGTVRIYDYV